MPRSFAFRAFSTFLLLLAIALLPGIAGAQERTIRRITNTPPEGINLNPSISGDGRRIAFESTEDITNSGGENYFRALRADVTTSVPTFVQLAISRSPSPAVSQDGAKIAFASKDNPLGSNPDGNSEIFYWDGQSLTQITNTTPDDVTKRATQGNFTPSMSDDGALVAFISNLNLDSKNPDRDADIFIYNSASRAFEIVPTDGRVVQQTLSVNDAFVPKISGNGQRIAFLAGIGFNNDPRPAALLYERATNALRFVADAATTANFGLGLGISDDGTRIVYAARATDASTQIFLYDDRSRQSTQITNLNSLPTGSRIDVPLRPTISGDGRTVAYATRRQATDANADRSPEIYVYDNTTRTTLRLTNAPASTSQTDETSLEVITSLDDAGRFLAFNFPRILSETVTNPVFAANSEIYLAQLPARQNFSENLRVVNAASLGKETAFVADLSVAPDSIALALGDNLAQTEIRTSRQPDGTFPTNVAGTTVNVNGRFAQIFFISPTRVDFLVPAEIQPGMANVVVRNAEGFETRGTVKIFRAAPGIYTVDGDGDGEAIAIDAATGRRGPFDPRDENGNARTIIFFATGVRNASNVSVRFGADIVPAERVERSTEMPGLDLVYVRLRSRFARRSGSAEPVQILADNRFSNEATVMFTGVFRPQRVEITPSSATVFVGGTATFRVIVYDEDGVGFNSDPAVFRITDPSIASFQREGDNVARVTGLRPGTTQIIATSYGIDSQPATITVREGSPPRVPAAGEVIINEALVSFSTSTTQTRADFVELFNKTNQTLDISGLTISFRPGGSTTTARSVQLPGAIGSQTTLLQPNAYFLVVNGASTFGISADFNADATATGNFDLNNTTGGISIDIGSTKLDGLTYQGGTAAAPAAFIAFGEGAIFAFTSGSVNDLVRTPNGQDTNDNAADFRRNGTTANISPKASNDVAQQPASVTISPVTANTRIGETVQFTAVVRNADGAIIPNAPVTFRSSNETVATIDANGLATARAAGTTQITATSGTVTSDPATLTVAANAPVPASVTITPATATINIGGTVQFTATVRDADGNIIPNATVTFRSSNEAVATVAQNGLATGRSAGTTQITATSGNATSQPATLTVTNMIQPRVPVAGEVVINEALVAFSTSTTQTRADFVELLNRTNETLDISGLTISFRPGGSTTTTRTVQLPGTSGGGTTLIQPNAYFLIANGANTFDVAADFNANADSSNAFDLNNTTGGIRIDIGAVKLDGLTYQGGTAAPPAAFLEFGEGAIFTFTSGATNDLIRVPNGADTNNNAADFHRNGTTASVSPKAANPNAAQQPASVTISPTTANARVGDTVQFTATVRDADGAIIPNASVTFSSSSQTVATVDANGLATARAAGTAQITATSGTVTSDPATLTVTAGNPTPASVTISPTTATTNIGGTVQFTATVRDSDGNVIPNATVTFSSSNETVATVNQSGLATGRSAGTTQITATSGNVTSQPATLTVTSSNPTSRVPVAGEVIINEAVVAFASSTSQTRTDFLELFNKTNATLDISGLTISFRIGGTSNTPRVVTLSGTAGSGTVLIQPNGYFLVANGAQTFGATADFDASAQQLDFNGTTGGIKIEVGGVKLDGITYQGSTAAPNQTFIDYGEGTIFTFTGATLNDLIRVPNGTDTNNNAADFRLNSNNANVTPKAANPTP